MWNEYENGHTQCINCTAKNACRTIKKKLIKNETIEPFCKMCPSVKVTNDKAKANRKIASVWFLDYFFSLLLSAQESKKYWSIVYVCKDLHIKAQSDKRHM